MSRPKMKEEKRRISVSLSLSPEAIELMEKTENKSRFTEDSMLGMKAISKVMSDLKMKTMSLEDALEDIEDLVDVWASGLDSEIEDYKFEAATTSHDLK